jgi:hypothetical protein
MVFAVHPYAPGTMMPDDVKLGCHQLISTNFLAGLEAQPPDQ